MNRTRKQNLKLFISFYKPYAGLFWTDLACALAMSGITLILPLGVRYMAGSLLGEGTADLRRLFLAGAALAVLAAIQAACAYFLDYQGHYMGAMMERDMRDEMFCHCERLSFDYYDEHTVGSLMSRLVGDSLSLAEFFHHVPEDLVINVVKIVGATIILLSIHWQTALVILAALPFMTLYTLHFNKKMAAALQEGRQRMEEINAQAEDTLAGIRVVQSFANEEMEEEKFRRRNERFLESRRLSYRGEAQLYCGMDTFSALLPILIVVFGGLAILNGSMALPDLLVFLLYVGSFTGPVQSLVNTSRLLQEGRTSFRRYLELMETAPQIQDSPNAAEPADIRGRIEFRDVSFRYDNEPVLQHIYLTIDPGEYVALVGASGVGKTTLCSLIPRFYQPQEGQVLLDGIPVEEISLRTLRRSIGVVQQDVYLFTGTVAENISYGRPQAAEEEIREAARQAGAHDFIQSLPQGYDTFIGPRGVKLSGGQQQRISIARAFLKNPPILILDEATSSLDVINEKLVWQSLERLAKHRTTLVIAHGLSTVRNAERILVLDQNGICEQGTHSQLMALGGVYARLYQSSPELA